MLTENALFQCRRKYGIRPELELSVVAHMSPLDIGTDVPIRCDGGFGRDFQANLFDAAAHM